MKDSKDFADKMWEDMRRQRERKEDMKLQRESLDIARAAVESNKKAVRVSIAIGIVSSLVAVASVIVAFVR